MSKRLTILIAILYLLVVSDLSIQIHWCGKVIHEWTIDSSKDITCDCDADDVYCDHCKNVHLTIKVQDSHHSSGSIVAKMFQYVTALLPGLYPDSYYSYTKTTGYSNTSGSLNSPPVLSLTGCLLI